MNDPFALDLTIILLLLGVGAAMVAGNLAAFFNKNHKRENMYLRRTFRADSGGKNEKNNHNIGLGSGSRLVFYRYGIGRQGGIQRLDRYAGQDRRLRSGMGCRHLGLMEEGRRHLWIQERRRIRICALHL